MIRFYLVPVETSNAGARRGPKYFPYRGDPDPPALVASGMEARDYGNEPSMLVASDLTDADDNLLKAQPDVVKFADNLDQQMGPDLATMQAALEALNLPAQMVGVNTTHRQVIRGIMAIFAVAQCMQGKGFNVFGGGVTLATTMGALSAGARNALQQCAIGLGYDITGITLASTVRQLLTMLVQQGSPSPMLGVVV